MRLLYYICSITILIFSSSYSKNINIENINFEVPSSHIYIEYYNDEVVIVPEPICEVAERLASVNVGNGYSFLKYNHDIEISFLEPIEPGKDKNVFVNDLETKIYSSMENLS